MQSVRLLKPQQNNKQAGVATFDSADNAEHARNTLQVRLSHAVKGALGAWMSAVCVQHIPRSLHPAGFKTFGWELLLLVVVLIRS